VSQINPFVPNEAVIKKIKVETTDVSTFNLAFTDENVQNAYDYGAGQYNMVSLPGIGEAPLSISSSPGRRDSFEHTVRFVGRLTNAWSKLRVGDKLGIRGPYGRPWPIHELKNKDVVVICGGTGIACIKPAINHIVENRSEVKSASIYYGAKNASELVFADQYETWQDAGVEVNLTVDKGQPLDWPFHVGVVTTLFDRLHMAPDQAVALISGPDIMMRFCVVDLLKRGFQPANIYVSLERRMECAVQMCGHCQIGPKYVCQDGPVFSYDEIDDLFGVVA
jgi:NAD(P)H-flavin reductase